VQERSTTGRTEFFRAMFTIPGRAIPKPRMTRRDKWAKRKCVLTYIRWANHVRAIAGGKVQDPIGIIALVYLGFPKTYSAAKKQKLQGELHRQKPDGDNILKGLCDAICKSDERIATKFIQKHWDDGKGERVEIMVWNSDFELTSIWCKNVNASEKGKDAGEMQIIF